MKARTIRRLVARLILPARVLVLPATALAGAWMRQPGGVYLRLATKVYMADRIFDAGGARVKGDWWDEAARFRELSFNLIAEVGVFPWLTATVENTAKLMNADYSGGVGGRVRVYGFSDVVLGLRYGPYQRDLVFAVEAKIEIPTGYPLDDDRYRLGPGSINGQFKALFGGGLPLGFGNYFDTSFGYRLRGGPFADDLIASAAVGAEPYDGIWLRVGFSGVFNLGGSSSGGTAAVVTGNQDASYLSLGGAVTYLFGNGFGVELAASGEVWGRNTFAGWGLELVVQFEK